jgi:hypothetical protein
MSSNLREINTFLENATDEEKRAFFGFKRDDSIDKVLFKFDRFARHLYPRYFHHKTPAFHHAMVEGYLRSYLYNEDFVNLGFRGCAKTSLAKLFIVFVILNDESYIKKYIKFLTKDLRNSKQLVTDVYNMIVEAKDLYGDVFIQDKEIKREETMSTFTLADGRKIAAGTVGTTHRGHIQDAYRPDWIFFDDIEDKESVSSLLITQGIIEKCDEALTGLAIESSYVVLGNYISSQGSIQWFLNKPGVRKLITPIMDEDGVPVWDVYSKEDVEKLKYSTLDFFGEYMCLHPNTPIYTSLGLKAIKDVAVGDTVLTHTGKYQKVLQTFTSNAEELLDITVDRKTVTITPNHPVLTEDGWKKAGDLTTTDVLAEQSQKKHMPAITSIAKSAYQGVVHNIEVETDNSYVTEAFIVHNCDPGRGDNKYFDPTMLMQDFERVKPPFRTFLDVKYWANFEQGHRYGIGADIGEGSGKDSSTLAVFDFTTNTLVASYHNNRIEPNQFAKELMRVGHEYGSCIIAPERNNNGVAVIENMRDYPFIFTETSVTTRTLKRTDKLGWHTNKKTKPMMFDEFRRDYHDGKITIWDQEVLKEMQSYAFDDITDSAKSLVTRHFDLITAVVIAWQMQKHAGFTDTDFVFEEEEPIYSDIGV